MEVWWKRFIKKKEDRHAGVNQKIEKIYHAIDEILEFGIQTIKEKNVNIYLGVDDETQGLMLNPRIESIYRSFANEKIDMYMTALLMYPFDYFTIRTQKGSDDILVEGAGEEPFTIDISKIRQYMNRKLYEEFKYDKS